VIGALNAFGLFARLVRIPRQKHAASRELVQAPELEHNEG